MSMSMVRVLQHKTFGTTAPNYPLFQVARNWIKPVAFLSDLHTQGNASRGTIGSPCGGEHLFKAARLESPGDTHSSGDISPPTKG